MQFKRTELELDIYGEKHILKFPTMRQFAEFAEASKEDGSNEIDLTMDFLEKLGLPKAVVNELEVPHLNKIVETLVPKKN